ncbi:hypothetical protein [Acutalibacter intestini]|nr:hypothetical protein [Acutalibacter sp. M00204]
MKKIISVLLSLALCLGMCPPVAMAEETGTGSTTYIDADKVEQTHDCTP